MSAAATIIPSDPAARAQAALIAFLEGRDAVTVPAVLGHLRETHKLDATPKWISRELFAQGWQKHREGQHYSWQRRRPDVIDLAANPRPTIVTHRPLGGDERTVKGATQ